MLSLTLRSSRLFHLFRPRDHFHPCVLSLSLLCPLLLPRGLYFSLVIRAAVFIQRRYVLAILHYINVKLLHNFLSFSLFYFAYVSLISSLLFQTFLLGISDLQGSILNKNLNLTHVIIKITFNVICFVGKTLVNPIHAFFLRFVCKFARKTESVHPYSLTFEFTESQYLRNYSMY